MKKPDAQIQRYSKIIRNHYSLQEYNWSIFLKTLHLKFLKGMCFDGTEIVAFGTINDEFERKFYFTSVRDIDEKFISLQQEIESLKEYFIIHYGL